MRDRHQAAPFSSRYRYSVALLTPRYLAMSLLVCPSATLLALASTAECSIAPSAAIASEWSSANRESCNGGRTSWRGCRAQRCDTVAWLGDRRRSTARSLPVVDWWRVSAAEAVELGAGDRLAGPAGVTSPPTLLGAPDGS